MRMYIARKTLWRTRRRPSHNTGILPSSAKKWKSIPPIALVVYVGAKYMEAVLMSLIDGETVIENGILLPNVLALLG